MVTSPKNFIVPPPRPYPVELKQLLEFTLWLVYGILNGLMAVIIWNGIALVLGCGMFYAKMKWGR
jgi:hypothetical protein